MFDGIILKTLIQFWLQGLVLVTRSTPRHRDWSSVCTPAPPAPSSTLTTPPPAFRNITLFDSWPTLTRRDSTLTASNYVSQSVVSCERYLFSICCSHLLQLSPGGHAPSDCWISLQSLTPPSTPSNLPPPGPNPFLSVRQKIRAQSSLSMLPY